METGAVLSYRSVVVYIYTHNTGTAQTRAYVEFNNTNPAARRIQNAVRSRTHYSVSGKNY